MAVIAISSKNTRAEDMNGAYGGVNIGAGAGGGVEPDFFYEGVQAWSRQVTNTDARGFSVGITAVNMTEPSASVLVFKGILTNFPALNANAYQIFIGDGGAGTDANRYIYADNATLVDEVGGTLPIYVYPIKGGWQIIPIDVTQDAWVDEQVGTAPTSTSIDEIGSSAGVDSSARAENIMMDAFDFSEGIFLTGGDGPDDPGTWTDFNTYDEGEGGLDVDADRVGHLSTQEGIFFVFGKFTIGEDSASVDTNTVFTDSLKTIVFPGGRVRRGWNAVEVELEAGSQVNMSNITFVGQGRNNVAEHFSIGATDTDVNVTTDEIHIPSHSFKTGEFVTYTNLGTSQPGLNAGSSYFVRNIAESTISLHTGPGRLQAHNDTNQRVLTAAAGDGVGILTLTPDTRPHFVARGVSGSLTYTSCAYVNCGEFVGTGSVAFNSCIFVGCEAIILDHATLDASSISDFLLENDTSAVSTHDLADITNNTFLRSDSRLQRGHALSIDTPGSYVLVGNTFTGWGPAEVEFHTINDVDAGSDFITSPTEHGYVTGEAIVYQQSSGSTDDITAVSPNDQVYAIVIDSASFALAASPTGAIADTRLNIVAGATGESHSFYAVTAAVANLSSGSVTMSITTGGNIPSVYNSTGSFTKVVAETLVTLTGMTSGSEVIVLDADSGGTIASVEDVGDTGEFAFGDAPGNIVNIFIHALDQVWQSLTDFEIPATDTEIPIQQQFDRNYQNPV